METKKLYVVLTYHIDGEAELTVDVPADSTPEQIEMSIEQCKDEWLKVAPLVEYPDCDSLNWADAVRTHGWVEDSTWGELGDHFVAPADVSLVPAQELAAMGGQ